MILDEYLMRIRQEEILRETERNRLIAQAKRLSQRKWSYSGRALTWFGNRLIGWGEYLQLRFGDAKKISQPQPVERGVEV